MGKFNEELVKAGVMLAGEGLQPSSKGARVQFSGDKRTVIDGPFSRDEGAGRRLLAVAGEVERGGDRMGQALPQSLPARESEIEIRQVFEAADFGAEFTPELREQEERLRSQIAKEKGLVRLIRGASCTLPAAAQERAALAHVLGEDARFRNQGGAGRQHPCDGFFSGRTDTRKDEGWTRTRRRSMLFSAPL